MYISCYFNILAVCPAGTSLDSDGDCVPCQVGTYSDAAGDAECIPCASAASSSNEGEVNPC